VTKKWREEWGPPLQDRVFCNRPFHYFVVGKVKAQIFEIFIPCLPRRILLSQLSQIDLIPAKARLTIPPSVDGIKESEPLPSFDLLHSTSRDRLANLLEITLINRQQPIPNNPASLVV
jgi:hypothetical protein